MEADRGRGPRTGGAREKSWVRTPSGQRRGQAGRGRGWGHRLTGRDGSVGRGRGPPSWPGGGGQQAGSLRLLTLEPQRDNRPE